LVLKLGGADELGVDERVMSLDVGKGHIVLQSTIVLMGREVNSLIASCAKLGRVVFRRF
jgi:hypothetical protein